MRAVPPQQQRRSLALYLPSGFLQKHASHLLSLSLFFHHQTWLFFDTFRYFRLFEFRFRPSKTSRSGRWPSSLPPRVQTPSVLTSTFLFPRSASFTTWKTRYRVNKRKKGGERSSGRIFFNIATGIYIYIYIRFTGLKSDLFERDLISRSSGESLWLVHRVILIYGIYFRITLYVVNYFLFEEKRERKKRGYFGS